jgi:membrane fusion protein (multidrug efflux system)
MQLLRTPRGAAALATVLVLAGCSQADKSPSAKPAPEVSVITAHRESIPITIELPGRTSPFLIAQVHARVDGIVQRRTFQEGADVKAGQLLYQIDPAPYRATLNSAQAAQQKAEANLANASAQLERYSGSRGSTRWNSTASKSCRPKRSGCAICWPARALTRWRRPSTRKLAATW